MGDPNLRVLKPSRKRVRAGDVFAMRPADERYLFGRVISTEAMIGPMVGCILIYVYRFTSTVKQVPEREELNLGNLLVPPTMINRLGWSRGYFETVAHWELTPDDVLAQHCFRRFNGRYYDDQNHELPGPVEPVGIWGLGNYRTIDDAISKALGIPLAPD